MWGSNIAFGTAPVLKAGEYSRAHYYATSPSVVTLTPDDTPLNRSPMTSSPAPSEENDCAPKCKRVQAAASDIVLAVQLEAAAVPSFQSLAPAPAAADGLTRMEQVKDELCACAEVAGLLAAWLAWLLVTHWRSVLVLWSAFAFGRRLPLLWSEFGEVEEELDIPREQAEQAERRQARALER